MRRTRERRRVLFGFTDKKGQHHKGLCHLRDLSIEKLEEVIRDTTHKDWSAAVRMVFERLAPVRELVMDAEMEQQGFTPEVLAEALRAAAQRLDADPTRAIVQAIDVEYEEVGNGSAH